MKPIYNLILTFLFIPFVSFGNIDTPIKKHEKSKTINKKYVVNDDATLYIKNKYGNINIQTWDKNRIEIEVRITVKGNDLDDVEQKLRNINVDFNAAKNLVEARTKIESVKSTWSSWFSSSKTISYEINYFVKMPTTNMVDLHNDYGNIMLDELKGKASIHCDYGKITIDKLLNKTNEINLDYCSKSTIGYINSGHINIDYSGLTVDKANRIKLNSDYSNLNFGEVDVITFNNDYGGLTIDEASDITGNSNYTGLRFGTVKKNLKIDTDYGAVKVKNLANNFESVDITGEYSGIKINTSSTNNFNFVIDLSYSGFKYDKDLVELYKSVKKSTSKYYEGVFGSKKSASKININSSFGSVSLQTND